MHRTGKFVKLTETIPDALQFRQQYAIMYGMKADILRSSRLRTAHGKELA